MCDNDMNLVILKTEKMPQEHKSSTINKSTEMIDFSSSSLLPGESPDHKYTLVVLNRPSFKSLYFKSLYFVPKFWLQNFLQRSLNLFTLQSLKFISVFNLLI